MYTFLWPSTATKVWNMYFELGKVKNFFPQVCGQLFSVNILSDTHLQILPQAGCGKRGGRDWSGMQSIDEGWKFWRTQSMSYTVEDADNIHMVHWARVVRRVAHAGGDSRAWLCSAILPTPGTSQGEMEDGHHCNGRGTFHLRHLVQIIILTSSTACRSTPVVAWRTESGLVLSPQTQSTATARGTSATIKSRFSCPSGTIAPDNIINSREETLKHQMGQTPTPHPLQPRLNLFLNQTRFLIQETLGCSTKQWGGQEAWIRFQWLVFSWFHASLRDFYHKPRL